MKEIKISETYTNNKEVNAVTKVIKSGWLTSGQITNYFENKVAKYLNSKNVIAVNSCTNGIFATLKALDLKKGDEVITSPYTFISTINTLYQLDLKIIFADISMDDYNIDFDQIKKKITKKTKCILITHFGGNPFDITKLSKIKNKKIKIVEDAATALGAEIYKKKIGSYSNSVSIFSLYANKIITTGEGGLISTADKKLAKRIRNLVNIGISKTPWVRTKNKIPYLYDLIEPGYKFNFTDLQASMGIEQLKKLDQIITYRKKIRSLYDKELNNLVKQEFIKILKINKNFKGSEYIYTILINKNKNKKLRDNLIKFLKRNKINTSVHYIPLFELGFYKNKFNKRNFPNTNYVYKNIISLPFHNNLKLKEVKYITKVINNFFKYETKKK